MSATVTCKVLKVPGPQGAPGADGTDGTNGVNAFSLVAVGFNVPAQLATVNVTLTDPAGNRWMALGQVVAVQGAGTSGVGFYRVMLKTGTTGVTLLNLRDDATGVYADNLDGVGAIAIGMWIAPGGVQGPDGSAAVGAFAIANNLNEGVAATMRTNLGLGALAVLGTVNDSNWSGTDLAVANGGTGSSTAANARTALGTAASGLTTASGLTVSATDKVLGRSSAGAGAVEEIACTAFARTLIDDVSATVARETLGKVGVMYGLIGVAAGVDANATADNNISMVCTRYRIDKLTVENASINLTTATAGLFTAAGGGGTTLAADQVLSALTASTKYKDLTLEAVVGTDVRTESILYFRIGTPQGSAATVDVWVWGWRLD